jgi:hypothetical protein
VPIKQLDLAALLGGDYLDADAIQSSTEFLPRLGIDDIEGAVTALEPVLDKRKQHPGYSSSAV